MPSLFASFFAIGAASAAILGCNSSKTARQASLQNADFVVAWVSVGPSDAGVATLTVALVGDASTTACPVLDAIGTANGVPMNTDEHGGLGSTCQYNGEGICSGQEPDCKTPSWSLANPPAGPLAIVLRDSSKSIEIDVGDVGTQRSIALVSTTDAANGQPGAITVSWSPASDAIEGWDPPGPIYGYRSQAFGVQEVTFGPGSADDCSTLDWPPGSYLPGGVTVQGTEITVSAEHKSLPPDTPPLPGGSGVLAVRAFTYVRTTRCDAPNCGAFVEATASIAAAWQPL